MKKLRERLRDVATQLSADPSKVSTVLAKEFGDVIEKAEMFDALMNQQRIRVNGSVGVGEEKYQYISVEMWTRHLGCNDPTVIKQTQAGRELLTEYMRTHARSLSNRNAGS